MKTIGKILPHASIILAGILIVVFIVDRFNGAMGFLDNDAARLMMLLLSITAMVNAITLVAIQRRRERIGMER